MDKQLASLLEQVDTPDRRVQVMPFSAGPYWLMNGTLILPALPAGSTIASEEGIEASHLYEGREAAKRWRRQYEVVRANALSLAESAELIRKAREDYEPCVTPPN
ncbi:Scr1 family TA system antitoxin-like transcriptional regulator [Streptomyces sp. NPDC048483]|uniref:Scr1 family TA system antitoxin-like transcriptional regulator n=1 Tax=Streptomyces sp. NPDC048483 TaxID=3154927 RepID=UPI0034337946